MYIELNIYDVQLSELESQELLFKALDLNINGINCPIHFIPLLHGHLPEGLGLSCPIDYPNGMSGGRVKNHAIISAIRKGANTIDVVLNHNDVINSRLKIIESDLSSHLEICKEKNITLRLMLDYRLYEPKKILEVAEIINRLNIEYIFPSTGYRIDAYEDNLLAAQYILKTYPKLNTIINGNVFTRGHYDVVNKSGVFGIRFNSIYAIQNCLSGV